MIAHLRGGQRPPRLDLGQDLAQDALGEALEALALPPVGVRGGVGAVPREGVAGQQAALLGEVLKGAPRELGPQLRAGEPVHAGQDHQLGVVAQRVQRVDLHASQPPQQRPRALTASPRPGPVERELIQHVLARARRRH
jgi:hypothetical protein